MQRRPCGAAVVCSFGLAAGVCAPAPSIHLEECEALHARTRGADRARVRRWPRRRQLPVRTARLFWLGATLQFGPWHLWTVPLQLHFYLAFVVLWWLSTMRTLRTLLPLLSRSGTLALAKLFLAQGVETQAPWRFCPSWLSSEWYICSGNAYCFTAYAPFFVLGAWLEHGTGHGERTQRPEGGPASSGSALPTRGVRAIRADGRALMHAREYQLG